MYSKLLFLFFIPFYISAQYNWVPTWGPNFTSGDCYHRSGASIFVLSGELPYKSTDGEHWQLLNNIPANHNITYITSSGNRLYLMGYKEVLYSDDQGNTWTQDTLKGIMSSYIKGNELFFASYQHLYYSPDKGTTWQYIRAHQAIIGMSYFKNQFYLCDNKGQLYTSADKGKTLQQITNPGQSTVMTVYGVGTLKENVLLNDNDNYLYLTGGQGLHRTTGNGIWTDINPDPSGLWVYNVHVDSGFIYVAGTGRYCFISNKNSISWKSIHTKTVTYDFIAFQNKLLNSGNRGINFSQDSGLAWQQAYHNLNTGTWGVQMESDGTDLWSEGWKSSDYGDTWNSYPLGDTLHCLKKRNSVIIAEHRWKYYRYLSVNNGLAWTPFSVTTLTAPATFDIHKQVIFAGSKYGGTYRSADLGKTWQPVHNSDFLTFVDLDSILFATTFNNLYKSNDGGQSWNLINFGLTNSKDPVWIIHAGGALYCQSIISPRFRSTDHGKTWTQLPEKGLHVSRRTSIAATTDRVFVSGYDYTVGGGELRHGIYELVLGDTAWHFLDQYVSTDYMLVHGNYLFAAFGIQGIERLQLGPDPLVSTVELTHQRNFTVYPNPCDDQLMVHCKQPWSGPLNLYDIHGRLVYSQEISNVTTSFSINTKSLATGFYFLRVSDQPVRKVSVLHN